MPQCLKNPGTAWGGYSAGFDAETVHGWAPTAHRSLRCRGTPAKNWCARGKRNPSPARRSSAANVSPTASHTLRGIAFRIWVGPRGPRSPARTFGYVTWREYMRQVVDPPQKQWRFSPEDILTTLPWGEKTLQTVAQQVRSAENRVLMAEKMASMAAALHGSQFPAERLQRAWDQLLWSQHHDAWITATTRTGRQAWAFQVAAETTGDGRDQRRDNRRFRRDSFAGRERSRRPSPWGRNGCAYSIPWRRNGKKWWK